MNKFAELGLNDKLIMAIDELGFTEPTRFTLRYKRSHWSCANWYGKNSGLWFAPFTID
jgi:hypothetical protein